MYTYVVTVLCSSFGVFDIHGVSLGTGLGKATICKFLCLIAAANCVSPLNEFIDFFAVQ